MTTRADYATARRQIKNLNRELTNLRHQHALTRNELDTYHQAINPTIKHLLVEYHALQQSADPTPTPTDGPKSAETPMPGQSTKWARATLDRINRRIQTITRDIQAALDTPHRS